jgi:RNA polymerase sporulation-specific sigma factor
MEEKVVEQVVLRQAMSLLPRQERQVLLLRYYKGMTQSSTARIIGVSQVQVSRIERRAVAKLRECLCEK